MNIRKVLLYLIIGFGLVLTLTLAEFIQAATKSEHDYQVEFCTEANMGKLITNYSVGIGKQNSYRFTDGKIADCVTEAGSTWELGKVAANWKEDIGQALHYAHQASIEFGRPFSAGIASIVDPTCTDLNGCTIEQEPSCHELAILYDTIRTYRLEIVVKELGTLAYQCNVDRHIR